VYNQGINKMSVSSAPRFLCLAIFAMACFLPHSSRVHGFELEQCEACLAGDKCTYCIKDVAEKRVGVCDCNDEEVVEYGDCQDVNKWVGSVSGVATSCNLLAYPKTTEVSVALIILITIIIFMTGCVVVSQFLHRRLCCSCGSKRKDKGAAGVALTTTKEGREMI
jgi:hypothetical protein